MESLEIRIEPAACAAAGALMAALDEDLRRRYPGLPTNGIGAEGFEAGGGVFAIGYVDGRPGACGAIRPWEGAAEIKRMYVAPEHRGLGVGRRMLGFLEEEAARRGYERGVLETGTLQHEAIGLYVAMGWERAAAFGPYVGAEMSVCFGKRLGTPSV